MNASTKPSILVPDTHGAPFEGGFYGGKIRIGAALFAIVWALKYIGRSSGLPLLLRVLRRARPALATVVAVFFVVLLISATLAYVFERAAQPQAFRSIPHALWWAIVTIFQVGDASFSPITFEGRSIAVLIMLAGVALVSIVTINLAGYLLRNNGIRGLNLPKE